MPDAAVVVAVDLPSGVDPDTGETPGELRPFVNIFVEGENVRFLQGLDTPITSGNTLHVIHSVAGG